MLLMTMKFPNFKNSLFKSKNNDEAVAIWLTSGSQAIAT
jgi:hypothetical protein